ncbi:hypothetical protein [Haloferula rosea]|uniref:DUF2207 domain-containing protein n=1 Tax=Haloferula rosea TaxID=490093 RepID=A0A934RF54_9BACT|nr:hypothetical protein [Haloferula rosea]MBK1827406.1 hypothetical protein [Haloferula rosea]
MIIVRLLLAGLLCAFSVSRAQETLFMEVPRATYPEDKTRVEFEALFSKPPPHGYLPVRVNIVNQRKTDGSINISTRSETGSDPSSDSELTSEFELFSKSATATSHDLLVPLTTDFEGDGTTVRVTMGGSFGRNSGGVSSSFAPDSAAVLMSESLYTPSSSTLDAELNGRSSGYGSYEFAARFEPTRMPADWRAYVGYDALLLTNTDWNKVPADARNGIEQWVRMGGRVVIYRIGGSGSFNSLGIEGEPDGSTMPYGYGSFELDSIQQVGTGLSAKKTVSRFSGGSKAGRPHRLSLIKDYSSAWPLHIAFGQQKFSYALFIIVLIVFGVLVGPVNLFVFAKSGQRHKLFITTPIISLATSVLLIVLILAKDGVGGRGMRVALIEVVPGQSENRAYVTQEQVSRTGVLVGGSFGLTEDAAITPVPIENSAWARLSPGMGGGGMRYTAKFKEGNLDVTGDWFQSRSEQAQLIQAVVPTRGRIEIKNSSGAPILSSTFEFPIESLYYKDRSGGYWKAVDLEAGNSVKASPINRAEYELARDTEGSKLALRQRRSLLEATGRAGHFFAVTSEAPAVETFDSIDWISTQTIITGPIVR